MTWPVEGATIQELGRFATPRPLDAEIKTHVHGALDLSRISEGTPIVAPEAGILYGFWLYIPQDRPVLFTRRFSHPFPWNGHRADLYGGVLVLAARDRTHLLTHLYMNQLLEYTPIERGAWAYVEEAENVRWPSFLWHSFLAGAYVGEGEMIGRVGNAGYSKGPHVHWEIHMGWRNTPHEERIDPEKWVVGCS